MKIIYKDGHVDECPQDQELHVIRHTAAHVMAQAIKRLYPEADFAFGPATENGFYYDVDLGDTKLTDEDLANIEKEMRKITKENLAIKPFILPRAEAVKLMEERHENYKVEHMADLADETEFSFFQQGEYVDIVLHFKAEQVAVKYLFLLTVRIKQHTHDFGVQRSGGLQ